MDLNRGTIRANGDADTTTGIGFDIHPTTIQPLASCNPISRHYTLERAASWRGYSAPLPAYWGYRKLNLKSPLPTLLLRWHRGGSISQPGMNMQFSYIPPRTSVFVEEALDHIRRTGQPETFPGLHYGPIDKNEYFEPIVKFDIDRHKRPDNDCAPCPMCKHPNKFLSGYLAYFPSMKIVAAIGQECASKEVLIEVKKKMKMQKDKEKKDFEQDFLLSQARIIPKKISIISESRKIACTAFAIHAKFARDGDQFKQQLRTSIGRDGELVLDEILESDIASIGPSGLSRGDGTRTRALSFGTLSGRVALERRFDPVATLDRISRELTSIYSGQSDDEALQFAVELDESARRRAYKRLREIKEEYTACRIKIVEFFQFFEVENLLRIKYWASHPANPSQFDLLYSYTGGVITITMRRPGEYFRADAQLKLCASLPTWIDG